MDTYPVWMNFPYPGTVRDGPVLPSYGEVSGMPRRGNRTVRLPFMRLSTWSAALYLLLRSLWRFFVTARPVTGADSDNATFLHAATKDYRDKPKERLSGPLWRKLAWRWALLGTPGVLAAAGRLAVAARSAGLRSGWVDAPYGALIIVWYSTVGAGFTAWGCWTAYRWWQGRGDRAELVVPTAQTVCRVLNHRYRQRDAHRMVVLPPGFDRRELADGEVPLPVRINLPVAGAIEERTKKNLAHAAGQTLGMVDPVTEWALKGSRPYMLLTPRPLPPKAVTWATVAGKLDALDITTPLIGIGNGNAVVTLNLATDSPHILVSGGSGTGKSVMLKCALAQRMHHGVGLIVLDYKRWSHRWAHALPGCIYAWQIEEIHEVLLAADAELARRISAPEAEHDNFVTVDVLVEEANALIPQLRNHWKAIRESEDPTVSPAIEAIQKIVFMGREMRMHVWLASQRASASVFGAGGGDARESFQTRMLAKWTRQTWKMLAGGTPYVRFPGGPRGIWARVQDDQVEIVRVPFFTDKEARDYATSGVLCPDIPLSGVLADNVRPVIVSEFVPLAIVTLSEALPALPGPAMKLDALRKASGRAGFPAASGIAPGGAKTYRLEDLQAWRAGRVEIDVPKPDPYFDMPRRPGTVYAYDTRHPITGETVLGYVGQTVQELAERDSQHATSQPWYDLVEPGSPYVLWEGDPTQAELDAIELARIAELRPLYNYEGQEGAAHAIPKPVAVNQRHDRDRDAGRPLWSPVNSYRPRRAPRVS